MAERKRRNMLVEGEKLRGAEKVRRIPVKVIPTTDLPSKPDWIRVKIPASSKISHIKNKSVSYTHLTLPTICSV